MVCRPLAGDTLLLQIADLTAITWKWREVNHRHTRSYIKPSEFTLTPATSPDIIANYPPILNIYCSIFFLINTHKTVALFGQSSLSPPPSSPPTPPTVPSHCIPDLVSACGYWTGVRVRYRGWGSREREKRIRIRVSERVRCGGEGEKRGRDGTEYSGAKSVRL